jgi:hypothetical protein
MKNLTYGILIVIIVSLLAGCATNPPKEESQDNPHKWQEEEAIIQPRR